MTILGLVCALVAQTRAAEILSLPGLEAPPEISPAKRRPRRKRPPKRKPNPKAKTKAKPITTLQPIALPQSHDEPEPYQVPKIPKKHRLEPSSKASPGNYAGRYFVFETLPDWAGPLAVEAGVKYVPPKGEASFSIRFIPKKHRLYHKPREFRRWLRERGAIDNGMVLDTVKIGKRYGSRTRYTTHVYGGRYLFGKRRGKRYNEMIVVPVASGAFQIHYEADYDVFTKFYPGYLVMLKSLRLPPARLYKAEKYYMKRRHLLRPLIEDRVDQDEARHGGINDWYGQPYRFVAQFGLPFGTKVSGRSLSGGKVIVLGGLREINEILSLGSVLAKTSYSGASALGLDLLVIRTNLMKQKPITPYFSFNAGVEQFKLDGGSSTGTVFSFGLGAAIRWKPSLDATMEFRYRNSALDGKEVAGTVNSPQLLLGMIYYFGKS